MTINTAHDFDQLPADEQSRLFGAWTPQTICRLLTTAAPDSTLRTMADAAGWDGLTPPPHPDGWEWDAERRMHIDPAPPVDVVPVPDSLTARQIRLALLQYGVTDAHVLAAIDQLPAEQQAAARIEWEYANDIHRAHPMIAPLAAALGLDVDAVFIAGSTL